MPTKLRPVTPEEHNRRIRKEAYWNLQSAFPRGQRVEAAPHTDAWMKGDRMGTVERIGRRDLRIYVRMDRSGKLLSFVPSNLDYCYTSAAERQHFASQLPA